MPPSPSRRDGVLALTVLALWVLALWPTRVAGGSWVDLALGALAYVSAAPLIGRATSATFLDGRLDPAAGPALAAGFGLAFSFVLASLHSRGLLPERLLDPRGGPTSLVALAVSGLLARRAIELAWRGAPARREDARGVVALGAGLVLWAGSWAAWGAPVGGLVAALVLLSSLVPDALRLDAIEPDAHGPAPPESAPPHAPSSRHRRIEELLARARTVFLRRAGVCTTGRLRICAIETLSPTTTTDEALHLAAAAEYRLHHPVREAILRDYGALLRTVPRLENVEHIAGKGVRAIYRGQRLLLGHVEFLREEGGIEERRGLDALCEELAPDTRRIIFLALGGTLLAAIVLEDPPRPGAREDLDALRRLGLCVGIISGEPGALVARFAAALGVDRSASIGRHWIREPTRFPIGASDGPVIVVEPVDGPHDRDGRSPGPSPREWSLSLIAAPGAAPLCLSLPAGDWAGLRARIEGARAALRRRRRWRALTLLHQAMAVPALTLAAVSLGPASIAAALASILPATLCLGARAPRRDIPGDGEGTLSYNGSPSVEPGRSLPEWNKSHETSSA